MSDLQLLCLILGVVYTWECVHWLRRGSVAFINLWGREWKLVHPASLAGNQSGGFVLTNPLPPLGSILLATQSPLSLSQEGALSYVAQCINPGWRPPQSAVYFRFDDIRKIDVSGKKVRVNGNLFIKTGSPFLAEQQAGLLRQLSKLEAHQRARAIQKILRESLDLKLIRERLTKLAPHATRLRTVSNILFFYLFFAVPAMVARTGWASNWLPLLCGLLILTTTAAILFYRAHKQLYPEAADERFTHWFLILLSPATTMRAHDTLASPLLATFHPLAAARALLPEKSFREFARKVVTEIRHPSLPVCPSPDPQAQATEQTARQNLQEALENFLKLEKIDVPELTRAPERADITSHSFCPRCEAQFTTRTGTCADCGGLALTPFPNAGEGAATTT